jgi:hypothetical protein
MLATLLALVLAACGGVFPAPSASGPPSTSRASHTPSGPPTPLPSIELPGQFSSQNITATLQALEQVATDHGGVRTAGTAGYDASVDYVVGQLESFAYQVQTPSFTMATYRELPGSTVSVLDGGPTFSAPDDFRAMIYSADGDLTATVARVGFDDGGSQGCNAADWRDFPEGSIALTPAGPCFRRDEVLLAEDAGAVALVVSYPDYGAGEARRPTLIQPGGIDIPVLSAIGALGDALSEASDAGAWVRIGLRTEIGSATVRNVIAETGTGGRVAMVGGHLDSVHDGPGINDNGSGVAAVLEIARIVAQGAPAGRYRFGFWAGEEFGLLGSRDYMLGLSQAERQAIAAYLNLDMIGSPNGVAFVYRDQRAAAASASISDYLMAWLRQNGPGAEPEDLGGSSDHYFFADAGIPTGGIFSGATERKTAEQAATYGGTARQMMDACYHLACDTAANVDVERTVLYAQAAARALLLIGRGDLAAP